MQGLRSIFKTLSIIAFVIFGLWGFILELSIINYAAGFWGVIIAFVILPVTFVAAPWYAVVAYGTWYPLIVVYGGCIFAYGLYAIGLSIAGE